MGRSYGMPEIDDDELEAELDALGDDFMLDEDTSYLDQASAAPDAPQGVPGMASNKVWYIFIWYFLIVDIFYNKIGKWCEKTWKNSRVGFKKVLRYTYPSV